MGAHGLTGGGYAGGEGGTAPDDMERHADAAYSPHGDRLIIDDKDVWPLATAIARSALEAVAPGLRARWVADALEGVAEEIAQVGDRITSPLREADTERLAWRDAAEMTSDRAAEYRDGTR